MSKQHFYLHIAIQFWSESVLHELAKKVDLFKWRSVERLTLNVESRTSNAERRKSNVERRTSNAEIRFKTVLSGKLLDWVRIGEGVQHVKNNKKKSLRQNYSENNPCQLVTYGLKILKT